MIGWPKRLSATRCNSKVKFVADKLYRGSHEIKETAQWTWHTSLQPFPNQIGILLLSCLLSARYDSFGFVSIECYGGVTQRTTRSLFL